MERILVSSSMIRSIGYDAETTSLEIEFSKGGAVWIYSEVPPEVHESLMADGSHGKFFLAHIKGKYPETKV